jgi:integrase
MPKKGNRFPKYVCEDVDRYGTSRFYLRKPGQRKIPLHGSPWSPAFMVEYGKAMYGETGADNNETAPALQVMPAQVGAVPDTLRWLCEEYQKDSAFTGLAANSQAARKRVLNSICAEPIKPGSLLLFGEMPIAKFGPDAVRVLMERKAIKESPAAANIRRKSLGYVFEWGKEKKKAVVKSNPVLEVKKVRYVKEPTIPWDELDFQQFKDAYPSGTRERRAFMLHLHIGARGCDVRLFGPQHIRNGRFKFVQKKTGGEVDVRVPQELAEELALAPKGDLVFIKSGQGRTFSEKGYNTWFNDKCRDAGIVGKTCHGIRAGAAIISVEGGATPNQMMALFGWETEEMAIHYTRMADKKRLADSASSSFRKRIGGTKEQ